MLVVEDDKTMAKLVQLVLEEEGFAVDVASAGEEGRTLALVNEYDGIILDLELGDRHGVEILQEIRRAGRTVPILVLTGSADSANVVRALDAGADEYAVKPVPNAELRSRARALVRRGDRGRVSEQLAVGNLTLNRLTRRLRCNGTEITLTAKELSLLEHLMLHSGEMVTRTELLEKVWDMQFDPGSNIVDVHMSRLRRKLEQCGADATITGRRGFGFVLSADVSQQT